MTPSEEAGAAQTLQQEQELLSQLCAELAALDVPSILVVRNDGHGVLNVADRSKRTRQVYVNLGFRWFYWGDRRSERAGISNVRAVADRVRQAVAAGWPQEEQGDLLGLIRKISNHYSI